MFDDRNSKITPGHLARKALVYVRQSSEKQVQENNESRRLQYRLRKFGKKWPLTQKWAGAILSTEN